MGFLDHRHDHGLEMFGGEDYNLVIVFLSLIVIHPSAKEICLLVGGTGFMMESEMVFC